MLLVTLDGLDELDLLDLREEASEDVSPWKVTLRDFDGGRRASGWSVKGGFALALPFSTDLGGREETGRDVMGGKGDSGRDDAGSSKHRMWERRHAWSQDQSLS